MADDTNWLKRNSVGNPFRMRLRRSNRFYAQDMDESIIHNLGKSEEKALTVSLLPRRSNIPVEKIKEMNFKVPAPMRKKIAAVKPISGFTMFSVSHNSVSRPSTQLKCNRNMGCQDQNSVKRNVKQSLICRPQAGKSVACGEVPKAVTKERKILSETCNKTDIQGPGDTSLLFHGNVVDQSTPNDTTTLRSILKQSDDGKKSFNTHLSVGEKSKARKRVNFNSCLLNTSHAKKRKTDSKAFPQGLPSPLEEDMYRIKFPKQRLNLWKTDDDSTVAFTDDFKPLNVEKQNSEIYKKSVEKEEVDSAQNEHKSNMTVPLNYRTFQCIMDWWKTYRDKVNDIRSQLRSLDETFQNAIFFEADGTSRSVVDNFFTYEAEKVKLYELLRSVEDDFRGNMLSSGQFRKKFKTYMEKKENILKNQTELDENFERSLNSLVSAYALKLNKVEECVES